MLKAWRGPRRAIQVAPRLYLACHGSLPETSGRTAVVDLAMEFQADQRLVVAQETEYFCLPTLPLSLPQEEDFCNAGVRCVGAAWKALRPDNPLPRPKYDLRQRCIRKGGAPPPPSPPSRAPSLCPATVPLTPSASLNGICNQQ